MTLGDVLATVGGILALCASAWTLFVAVALLFVSRSNRAADTITTSPWKNGILGFLATAILGPVSILLITVPIPGSRLIGLALLLGLLTLAAIGGSGVALIAARRIRTLDPGVSPFAALCRGAAFVVVPSLLPVLGWFLLGPAVFVVGLGAGLTTLRSPVHATQPLGI